MRILIGLIMFSIVFLSVSASASPIFFPNIAKKLDDIDQNISDINYKLDRLSALLEGINSTLNNKIGTPVQSTVSIAKSSISGLKTGIANLIQIFIIFTAIQTAALVSLISMFLILSKEQYK